MFIFRTVVGKLWLTIMALVAFVLLILGFFLVQFIQEYFYQATDQTDRLSKMAVEFADGASQHVHDKEYFEFANQLLGYQDASFIVVTKNMKELTLPENPNNKLASFHATDFFSEDELKQVFEGKKLLSKVPKHVNGRVATGSQYVAVAVPLKTPDGGAFILYQSLSTSEDTQQVVIRLFVYVAMIGFLMTTFFALFLFYRITQPLHRLRKAAAQISRGNYTTKVPIVSNDEIGELAKTFNRMGGQLEETIRVLSHQKEQMSSVLRSMTDAVISLDADGNVMLTNPQGQKIIKDWGKIDWNRNASTAILDSDSQLSHPLTLPDPLQRLFDYVITEAKETFTKLHVQNEVWSVVMTPLYGQNQVVGAVAVLRDVTEEHRMDKLRKDFVANVSHELRTPLSMVQGYSEALIDDIAGTPDERKELAQVIHDESLRMGRLVKDLLDLAKMEAGHMSMTFRELDVNTLFQRIQRKFSGLAKEREIRLICELPEGNHLVIEGDEDRLEQVLTNLLDNAFRHTHPHMSVTLRAELSMYNQEEAVLIEVEDEGQGIPAEDVPYVFERFYKADKARTRGASGGTGLGLAIVKNIIDAHDGKVQVQSILGKGTTFSIFLPKYRSARED